MATIQQIKDALQRAAEALLGRPLNDREVQQLYNYYAQASGTPYDRALEALRQFTSLTRPEITKRASASDNIGRRIDDLKDLLED